MSAAFSLTPRMAETLEVIREHIARRGMSPTYQEICAELGLASKSNAARLVYALEERGHIERLPRCRQSIRLLGEAPRPASQSRPASQPPTPQEISHDRPVEKRCTVPSCKASYVTTYRNQQRCWNCQVRALQAAKTPVWPVENAR